MVRLGKLLSFCFANFYYWLKTSSFEHQINGVQKLGGNCYYRTSKNCNQKSNKTPSAPHFFPQKALFRHSLAASNPLLYEEYRHVKSWIVNLLFQGKNKCWRSPCVSQRWSDQPLQSNFWLLSGCLCVDWLFQIHEFVRIQQKCF